MRKSPRSRRILTIIVALLAAATSAVRHSAPAQVSESRERASDDDATVTAEALGAEYRALPTPSLKRKLVDALLAAGENEQALAALDADARLPAAEAAMLRAEALLRLGRPTEAANEAGSFAEAAPALAAYYTARARLLAGDHAGAKDILLRALKADGPVAAAWVVRAEIALSENDFDAAASATARAREAGAAAAALAALRAEFALRRGPAPAADAVLAQTIGLSSIDRTYFAALRAAAAGRFAEAASHLRELDGRLTATPSGRLFAALIRVGAGDDAQAEREFARALEIAPQDATARAAFVDFLIKRRRYDDAAAEISSLAAISLQAAQFENARLADARGDVDGAFAALVGGPITWSDPRVLVFGLGASGHEVMAAALLDAGRRLVAADDGSPDGARANAAAGGARGVLDLARGELALRRGDFATAQNLFGGVAAAHPASVRARLGLIRADLAMGDEARARALIESRAPSSAAFAVLKSRLSLAAGRRKEAERVLRPYLGVITRDRVRLKVYLAAAADDAAALDALGARLNLEVNAGMDAADVALRTGHAAEAYAIARRLILAGPLSRRDLAVFFAAAAGDPDREADARALLTALHAARPDDPVLAEAASLVGRLDLKKAAETLGAEETLSLAALRQAYLAYADDPGTAFAYAQKLTAAGAGATSLRLQREACFWGETSACPPAPAAK